LRGLLVDDRDTPLLYLLMNVCVFVLPAAVALFCLPASHALGGVYLAATIALFFQRFILALHYSEHRGLFRNTPGAPPIHTHTYDGPRQTWNPRASF